MARVSGEVTQPVSAAVEQARRTRSRTRIAALVMYAVALLVWVRAFGVPSDTVQIFLWLWLATIAWNIEAPWRYHLGFLRDWWALVAGLVVYF